MGLGRREIRLYTEPISVLGPNTQSDGQEDKQALRRAISHTRTNEASEGGCEENVPSVNYNSSMKCFR